MYSNMYISWWMYFVTGLRYVLQQPSTAGPAKTKADIAKKSFYSYLSLWSSVRKSQIGFIASFKVDSSNNLFLRPVCNLLTRFITFLITLLLLFSVSCRVNLFTSIQWPVIELYKPSNNHIHHEPHTANIFLLIIIYYYWVSDRSLTFLIVIWQ